MRRSSSPREHFGRHQGRVEGDAMVDYVRARCAGQTLSVKLQKTNAQNYFKPATPGVDAGSAYVRGRLGENYSACWHPTATTSYAST